MIVDFFLDEALRVGVFSVVWVTWVVELLTIALAVRARVVASRRGWSWLDLRQRTTSSQLPDAFSALWCIPLLVWSLETSLLFWNRLEGLSMGLTHPGPEYLLGPMVAAVISLGLLAAVQGAACLLLGYRGGVLGVSGKLNTAVQFALLTTLLDILFCLGIWGF